MTRKTLNEAWNRCWTCIRLTRTEDDNGLNTLNRKEWRYIVQQHSIYWSARERRELDCIYMYYSHPKSQTCKDRRGERETRNGWMTYNTHSGWLIVEFAVAHAPYTRGLGMKLYEWIRTLVIFSSGRVERSAFRI